LPSIADPASVDTIMIDRAGAAQPAPLMSPRSNPRGARRVPSPRALYTMMKSRPMSGNTTARLNRASRVMSPLKRIPMIRYFTMFPNGGRNSLPVRARAGTW